MQRAAFLAALFLCLILPRLCRARACTRMYAHTNEIIDILFIILYIYRKQECNYNKAEKENKRTKERENKRKKQESKKEITTQRQKIEMPKKEATQRRGQKR